MVTLSAPWAGLAGLAPRVDLWAVLAAVGGPVRAAAAGPGEWCAAGLTLADALVAAQTPGWNVPGIHAGIRGWPSALDRLPKGPVALCAEGNLALLGRPCVGIVGSRHCTNYGRDWARRISRGVVDAGGVVVSGLAAGIDSEAHGAAGGQTIAVLGQGLLAPMPAWQCRVREAILADGGLVLSEFPPDAPAQTWTFPIRNRIIAGLAGAVVVVEAGQRSGARITARNALEYGREVLAVPGPLGAAASAGCLDLIEQGATMVRAIATVLQAARLGGVRPERAGAERDARVLAALGPGGTPEQVEGATGLDRRAVMAALGALELTGRVTRLPGRRYIPA